MSYYKKIVVAIDLNSDYQHIIDKVAILSMDGKVEVVLASVVDVGIYELASSYKKNIVDEVKAEYTDKLVEIKSTLLSRGVGVVKLHVGVGVPKKILAHDVYEIFNPDLMVCGDSINKRKEAKFLIGSVANYILHNIECDVLVVKTEG